MKILRNAPRERLFLPPATEISRMDEKTMRVLIDDLETTDFAFVVRRTPEGFTTTLHADDVSPMEVAVGLLNAVQNLKVNAPPIYYMFRKMLEDTEEVKPRDFLGNIE